MKKAKVISVIAIVLMLACVCTSVFATGRQVDIGQIQSKGNISDNSIDAMESLGGTIIKYITNAAMVIAVVMVAALGIKYMVGSAEEKAEYKKSLLPLLIGAILVFGAAAIARVIVGLAGSFKV